MCLKKKKKAQAFGEKVYSLGKQYFQKDLWSHASRCSESYWMERMVTEGLLGQNVPPVGRSLSKVLSTCAACSLLRSVLALALLHVKGEGARNSTYHGIP